MQAVPSRWEEPFGLVAAEAMMRGTAVVASESGGLAEQVEPGATGYLAPAGDAGALARALEQVVRDRDLAERMGASARVRALAELTTDRHVDRVTRRMPPVGGAGVSSRAVDAGLPAFAVESSRPYRPGARVSGRRCETILGCHASCHDGRPDDLPHSRLPVLAADRDPADAEVPAGRGRVPRRRHREVAMGPAFLSPAAARRGRVSRRPGRGAGGEGGERRSRPASARPRGGPCHRRVGLRHALRRLGLASRIHDPPVGHLHHLRGHDARARRAARSPAPCTRATRARRRARAGRVRRGSSPRTAASGAHCR
ncbi:MAG: glycosyltransferase [Betaproteobacteria bacterium]|nr:glycosyltransferase [Betaproteobacteria bacterium]